jgi:hypothetical protein
MSFGRIFLLLTLLAVVPLRADGLEVKDGRYAGGPSVVIKLTPTQARLIQTAFKPGMELTLTKPQQAHLRREASLKLAPTKIYVGHASDWAHDCTCFASNIAIDFKPGYVELPVRYLMSDKEAEENHAE